MGKIILTSQGLCTQMGDRLVHRAISDMGDRENKKILLVDIKKYRITEKLKEACISMGFEKSNIFATSEAEAGGFPDSFEYECDNLSGAGVVHNGGGERSVELDADTGV